MLNVQSQVIYMLVESVAFENLAESRVMLRVTSLAIEVARESPATMESAWSLITLETAPRALSLLGAIDSNATW